MRLLLFSDLQLDANHPIHPAARDTFASLCDLAIELEVDAVGCAGNLYRDGSADDETARFLIEQLRRLRPIDAIFTPGSSDWYYEGCLYDRLRSVSGVHVFTGSRLSRLDIGDTILWGAAHRAPHQTLGFLDGFHAPRAAKQQVALFHGMEADAYDHHREVLEATAPFRAEQVPRAGLSHVFAGGLPAQYDDWYTYPGRGTAVRMTVPPAGQVERRWYDLPDPGPLPEQESSDDGPEPAWIADILDGPEPDISGYDDRATVLARFVTDVDTSLDADLRRRVLRAGLRAADEGVRPRHVD